MTASMTNCEPILVNVPQIEVKKFMAIVKALGFSAIKQSSMDRALAQVAFGQVYDVESVDELIKIVG